MSSEFQKQLEEARKPTHSGMHPFTQAWVDGELTRKQLGLWAIQHYYYIEPIAQQFAILFSRLPDLDARTHMLENLLGEEDPKGRHPDLLLDFAQYCGVDRNYAMTAELRGEILRPRGRCGLGFGSWFRIELWQKRRRELWLDSKGNCRHFIQCMSSVCTKWVLTTANSNFSRPYRRRYQTRARWAGNCRKIFNHHRTTRKSHWRSSCFGAIAMGVFEWNVSGDCERDEG
ncbi:MAG: hypothetical protein HC846_00845 [Blastocatellia bacterium]|nr:hypothetical protein [Blastocatellia bacterium]